MHTPPDRVDREDFDLDEEEPPFSRLFRDFLAFEVKLFLDGLKDLVLAQAAVIAVFIGFLRRRRRGELFYGLMRLGGRFEHWLGLYRPLDEEGDAEDAPFGGANRALREAERRIRKRRDEREEGP